MMLLLLEVFGDSNAVAPTLHPPQMPDSLPRELFI